MDKATTATRAGAGTRSYLVAAALAFLAIAARGLLYRFIDVQVPFLFAFPCVVLVSLWFGLGPGLLTVIIAVGWDIAFPDSGTSLNVLRATVFAPVGFATATLAAAAMDRQRALEAPAVPGVQDPGHRTAERWLSILFTVSAIIPAMFFAIAAWESYVAVAARADDELDRASRIMEEHALKVFETNEVLSGRVRDILDSDDNIALHEHESEIHQRLMLASRGIPQVQGISAWDMDGHGIASGTTYPLPADYSIADRAYFRELRSGPVDVIITAPIIGPLSHERIFFVAQKRQDAEGAFNGVTVVALYPAYFEKFYRDLADGQPTLTLALARTDGTILARYPELPALEALPASSPLLAHMHRGEPEGHFNAPSTVDGADRIVGFRRLGAYPLYVAAGINQSAVLTSWLHYVQLLAALTFPTSFALIYVTWRTLRSTRRDLLAADELARESRRRFAAETALKEAQKLEALGRLTGGVAHDFNNLLSVMSNNLYVLEHRNPGGLDKQFAAMRRSIKAGERLTRQLLAFSRRQPMRPETVSLPQMLPALTELLRHTLGQEIVLVVTVEPDTRYVQIDTSEFELALINLAINAKDAMPRGGTLHVSAQNAPDDRGFVEIRIKDEGEGVAESDIARIFEPFFTTKDVGKGTGLGLSQVYGFCVQSQGTVTVTSTVGEGATFTLRLPVSVDALTPTEATIAMPIAAQLKLRILIVEDNPDVSYTTSLMLREAGANVSQVENAATALDVLRRESYDAMVSDIMMPGGMTGIALATQAREEFPQMRIVLVSGYTEELELAGEQGFTVLAKPTEFEALRAALADAGSPHETDT